MCCFFFLFYQHEIIAKAGLCYWLLDAIDHSELFPAPRGKCNYIKVIPVISLHSPKKYETLDFPGGNVNLVEKARFDKLLF